MIKVAEKITKELRADEDFKKELNACVWSEVIEPEEFEERWSEIMTTYGLIGNDWFETMYENRQYWVPAYFKNKELSGLMKTTSISESENSFYKRYTKCRSNLVEFWLQYNNALEAQRYQQTMLNYKDKTSTPSLQTELYMEKHASRVYSSKFFIRVQEQIIAAQGRDAIFEIKEEAGKEIYKIVDQFKEEYYVTFEAENSGYECSCKMIIRMGLLCSHVLCVMKNKFVQTIPEKYILERWKKAHLARAPQEDELQINDHYVQAEENKRLMNRITSSMFGWMQKLDGDTAKLTDFLTAIEKVGNELTSGTQVGEYPTKNTIIQNYYGVDLPENVEVNPPEKVKTKGSGSRLVSRREKEAKQQLRPLRRCGKCKQMAHHDSRNCDKLKKT